MNNPPSYELTITASQAVYYYYSKHELNTNIEFNYKWMGHRFRRINSNVIHFSKNQEIDFASVAFIAVDDS